MSECQTYLFQIKMSRKWIQSVVCDWFYFVVSNSGTCSYYTCGPAIFS